MFGGFFPQFWKSFLTLRTSLRRRLLFAKYHRLTPDVTFEQMEISLPNTTTEPRSSGRKREGECGQNEPLDFVDQTDVALTE